MSDQGLRVDAAQLLLHRRRNATTGMSDALEALVSRALCRNGTFESPLMVETTAVCLPVGELLDVAHDRLVIAVPEGRVTSP